MEQHQNPDRLLRLDDVLARIGVSRRTLWRLVKNGQFPRSIKVGYLTRWSERAVAALIESRITKSAA